MAEGDKASVLARDPLFSFARFFSGKHARNASLSAWQWHCSISAACAALFPAEACTLTPPPLLQADAAAAETFT